MEDVTIRPTGTLRVWGWPLIVVGVLLVVVVAPLFTIGGATDRSGSAGMLQAIGSVAPWLGGATVLAGAVLVVIAARRAAANREAVQRASLEALRRQQDA